MSKLMKNDKDDNKPDLWLSQIALLEMYAKLKLRINVQYTHQMSYDADTLNWDTKTITLRLGRRSNETSFYVMLHELGHVLMTRTRAGRHVLVRAAKKYKTQISRVAVLEEEMEAWRLGYNLAKKLDMHVNQNKFDRVKSACLTTYILDIASRDSRLKKQKEENIANLARR